MRMNIMSLLGVVFITLKLVNVIQWNWIWVLAPFWGLFLLDMLLFIIAKIIDECTYRKIINHK